MKHRNLDNVSVLAARRLSADSWYINEARGLRAAYLSDRVNKSIGKLLRQMWRPLIKQRREHPLSVQNRINQLKYRQASC